MSVKFNENAYKFVVCIVFIRLHGISIISIVALRFDRRSPDLFTVYYAYHMALFITFALHAGLQSSGMTSFAWR